MPNGGRWFGADYFPMLTAQIADKLTLTSYSITYDIGA
jgi:hypothetical protein